MRAPTSVFFVFLLVLLVEMVGSCGYQWVRPHPAFGARSVAVIPFDEVQIAGLSAHVTQSLSQQLRTLGYNVTHQPAQSDATLTGTISLGTVPGTTLRTVAVYVVEARVHAELRDRSDALLWQTDVALEETFLPTDPELNAQPLTTEMRRRTALMRLGELCAERVAEALLLDAQRGEDHV